MIKVNVLSEEKAWSKKIKKSQKFFDNICKKFPKKFRFLNKRVYLTLLLSNNKRIKDLNRKFRKKNKPTDILSFPFYTKKEMHQRLIKEKEIYLGDIIINLNKIKDKKKLKNFKNELNNLWIHGLVHLFGHDHKKEKDFLAMKRIEKKYSSFIND